MTMSLNEALAEIIRERIDSRGMTMASLARVSGVSRESLRNYIQRGKRTMPVDVLAQVAPALGLTTYDLVRLAQELRDSEPEDPPGEAV
ncbi:MAG: helix-turn-helix domain-containing protein [Nocardioidaceae bacterium]